MRSALRALAALGFVRLEDGRRWDDTAAGYQRENAAAILDVDDSVKQTWIELPRSARKTSDLAKVILTVLAYQAPKGSHSYVGASDEEQAAELIDAANGLI